MTVQRLDDAREAELRAAPLTYSPAGGTTGPRPGFGWFERTATLQRRDFDAAAQDLFAWRVQSTAGLRVRASDSPLRLGTVVLMGLGWGPLSLSIPCRVVDVVDEPDRRGFAYGTLPGHPETGEERFVLQRLGDGSVQITVSAFSRPATRLAALGGPLSTAVQTVATRRYLRALDSR